MKSLKGLVGDLADRIEDKSLAWLTAGDIRAHEHSSVASLLV